jgi:hypothetical protein
MPSTTETTTTTTETTTETAGETTTSSKFNHQNFQTKVGRSDFLLAVLKEETPEQMTAFGIAPEALTEFESSIDKVRATDKDQEEAKAALKILTARLQDEMKVMGTHYSTFKQKIKAETPMEEWKKYGFQDKQ